MRYGSVCSGIEAATVALHGLGWSAAWYSEIEPFPCAVLAYHYPQTPNLGDMTLLPERIRSGEVEAPDILCGGTPCQAFSVAGQRQSLADARGNLTLTFCEVANAIDDVRRAAGHKPAIIVWENVPGVLNTDDNAFGCFLAGVAGEHLPLEPPGGRWTDAGAVYGPARAVAWRVLDAQYFGLAQRRRRVFVVASARDDIDCASILFERDGLRRDFAPSRATREVAPTSPSRSIAGGGLGTAFDCDGGVIDVVGSLDTECGGGKLTHQSATNGHLVATYDSRQHHNPQPSETAQLTTKNCAFMRGDSPLVAQVAPAVYTLEIRGREEERNLEIRRDGTANALRTPNGGRDGIGVGAIAVERPAHAMAVRRLTPRECERLQGFPDDYTAIAWRKKLAADCPDGPRYKALGNSWAVPVVRWIGQRIADATNPQSTPTVGATA